MSSLTLTSQPPTGTGMLVTSLWRSTRGDIGGLRWRWAASSSSTRSSVWSSLYHSGTQVNRYFELFKRKHFNHFSVIQIKSRHNFLEGFLGTKPKEDTSYAKANEVNLLITMTTCICCFLEILLYFAYNRMVNNQNNVDPGVAGPFGVLCW